MIERDHDTLSVRKQCQLLGLSRSSLYYRPVGPSQAHLALQRRVDEIYTDYPFYGARRMVVQLQQEGYAVGRKGMRTIYQELGLEAVYPKPNLSQPDRTHVVYPYLLRGVQIDRVHQVYSTDITYIRLKQGFVYLVAIIDWRSRYVLEWRLSTGMDADFCIEALEAVLAAGYRCEIFNSDQGSQFTSIAFTELLKEAKIQISMDGKGRALDNIFVERLWRSVKYECIYLREFEDVKSVRKSLSDYFEFYNHERPHQALGYRCPAEVFLGKTVQ